MIDPHSETWKTIAAECERRIEGQQRRLEGPLDQPDTDRARGAIRAMRDILSMGNAAASFAAFHTDKRT